MFKIALESTTVQRIISGVFIITVGSIFIWIAYWLDGNSYFPQWVELTFIFFVIIIVIPLLWKEYILLFPTHWFKVMDEGFIILNKKGKHVIENNWGNVEGIFLMYHHYDVKFLIKPVVGKPIEFEFVDHWFYRAFGLKKGRRMIFEKLKQCFEEVPVFKSKFNAEDIGVICEGKVRLGWGEIDIKLPWEKKKG